MNQDKLLSVFGLPACSIVGVQISLILLRELFKCPQENLGKESGQIA